MLRTARLSHFDVTLLFEVTDSSCFQRDDGSLLVPADARAEPLVQSHAEPSWQEGSDILFLPLRIEWFSELNKRLRRILW
jgi:hypothetical protein